MKIKLTNRSVIALLLALLSISLLTACAKGGREEGEFPNRDLTGIVQWGPGGGTDVLMRPLAALAEKELGKNIVVQNMPGATGALATQHVNKQAADGYTLLMGAENPQLYKLLEISDLTYEDFQPVFLIGDERVGIVVRKDSKYKSFKDLIDDALANPGEIKIATTGKGGMPWTMASFIKAVTGAEFNQIPFDSDAAALTAVLGGHADFTACKIQTGIEAYRAGEIEYLSLMALEKVDLMPEVPLVTEEYPAFEEYLPWGPFYGIFVHQDTPQDLVDRLSGAFSQAFEDQDYRKVLEGFHIMPLGLRGQEAKEYLKSWQKSSATALYKSGAIKEEGED